MKFGVVVFPGSNCDHDMMHVLGTVMGAEVQELWHKDRNLHGLTENDCIILPGGFSYGDYLRAGAIAKLSPIMESVIDFANRGGYVLGICNGFQILCESGLLPGVLLRNKNQRFISRNTFLKTENHDTALTNAIPEGKVLQMPIAHADGRYFIEAKGLAKLNQNKQILFRYCNEEGIVDETSNLNGSLEGIAGICNEKQNVFGMMPHPERASEMKLGCDDGKWLFNSLVGSFASLTA